MVLKIMLIVMSIIKLDSVLERAFDLAVKKEGELVLTFVQGGETPSPLSSLLTNSGFLGEKVQSDVKKTVKKEYNRQAHTILDEIKNIANKKGVKVVETEHLKKNSLHKCYDLIDDYNIDYLFLNFTNNKIASHTLFEYLSSDFVKNLEIPYEMYMDGEKQVINTG